MATDPAAAGLAPRLLDAPTPVEERAAQRSLRLALWSFGLVAVTSTFQDPMLTAPIAGGDVPIDRVDLWFAIAIPAVGGLVALAYLGLTVSAAWIRRVKGAGGLGLIAAAGLGIEAASRVAILAGAPPGPLALSLAVKGAGTLGWIALLLVTSQTVRRFGRHYPLGPMFWAVLLVLGNFSREVVDATGRPEMADYERFTRVSWLVLTFTALVAAIAIARGRRAVLRAITGVAPSADEPAKGGDADDDGLIPTGWSYATDGMRVAAGGMLVQVVATGLAVGLLFAIHAVHIELVFRTVVLVGPVAGGLSSALILAGAHGLAVGPSLGSTRLLAWLAAGLMVAALVGAGVSYTIAIAMFEDPLRSVELAGQLAIWDAVLPVTGYAAVLSILALAERQAAAFGEPDLVRRARGFRNLTLFTAAIAFLYLLSLRINLGTTLQVSFGVLAVFTGAWLLIGSWSVLRRLADAIEAAFRRSSDPEPP